MKLRSFCLLFLLIPAFIFAQGTKEQAVSEVPVFQATDANNRTVELTHKPSNVLIAGRAGNMPANALFLFEQVNEMDLTLPLTDQGLGDFFAFIRPELNQKPRISQNASIEEIATHNSDVVLLKATHFSSIGQKLDQLRVPNFTMNLESWEDWQKEIVQLGLLLGDSKRAEAILSLYRQRLEKIQSIASAIDQDQKMRVLLLQGDRTDNTTSYKIAPDGWMQTWMVEQAGAIPVWKGSNKAANGWSTVSFEQIAAWDPDIVIVVSYRTPTSNYIDEIYSSSIWQNLRAVKEKQIKASPHDMMSYIQPVASWILGATWLAKEIYPQAYSEIDMQKEVRSFYQDFYNIKDAEKLEKLVDLYAQSVAINTL
ncbi:MAG: ABC transporter substrate-binding protein [Spirochaetia bacterium]|nr:ABC transporter substrate-binding protein [Spirochaetia bacterium]